MNTDEKNDKLKFCLTEVGSLIIQLIDRNQLNLISQDNKENLLMLKKGIDGLNDGPKIDISDAQALYEQFASSSFMSLYGCLSWAEDFAEFVTWYHYSNKLGQPYRIRLLRNDDVLIELSPVNFDAVRSRESSIQSLYKGN